MTVAYSPAYPVAGESVTLSVASPPTGNTVVWEVLSRPALSALALAPLDLNYAFTGRTAQQIADDEAALDSFSPDVAGEYSVVAYEFNRFQAPVNFDGSPLGELRTVLVSATTATVYVGDTTDLEIVNLRGDGATLRLTVVDTTVRAASMVNATTELARVAALDSTVISTLTSLAGVAVTSIGNGLQTDATDLRAKYEPHHVLTAGSVHSIADNTNATTRYPTTNDTDAVDLVNELAARLTSHAVARLTAGGGAWHANDDTKNVLAVAPVARTKAAATVLLADLRERVYERHRVQTAAPAVHGASDSGNALTAPTRLDNLIVAYLDALEAASFAAAAGEPEGLDDAERLFGFRHA